MVAPTPEGANLLFGICFAENCMKMKKNGLREGTRGLLDASARSANVPHQNIGFALTVGSSRVKLIISKLDTKIGDWKRVSRNLFFRPCRFSVDNSGHLRFKV